MIGSFSRGLIPGPLLRHLRALRGLAPGSRWIYVRCRLRRLGRRAPALPVPAWTRSLLFVCHGNIIRSAMAEQLMRRECAAAGRPEVSIHSAGVHARAGRPADSRAIEVAPEFGVSLESHRAAELSPEVIADADLIVVMDYLNEAELLSRYPSVAPKLALMGEFLAGEGARRDLELPDPYMQDVAAIRACFARIQQGVLRLANGQGAR